MIYIRSVLTGYDGDDCFSCRRFSKDILSGESYTDCAATEEWNTGDGFEDGALSAGLIPRNDNLRQEQELTDALKSKAIKEYLVRQIWGGRRRKGRAAREYWGG